MSGPNRITRKRGRQEGHTKACDAGSDAGSRVTWPQIQRRKDPWVGAEPR